MSDNPHRTKTTPYRLDDLKPLHAQPEHVRHVVAVGAVWEAVRTVINASDPLDRRRPWADLKPSEQETVAAGAMGRMVRAIAHTLPATTPTKENDQ